jgi:hypothetical protein
MNQYLDLQTTHRFIRVWLGTSNNKNENNGVQHVVVKIIPSFYYEKPIETKQKMGR